MTTLLTSRWDAARSLDNAKVVLAYFEEAVRDGDRKLMAAALDDYLRSLGAFSLEAMTGISREAIFRALGRDDNPGIDELVQSVIESSALENESV